MSKENPIQEIDKIVSDILPKEKQEPNALSIIKLFPGAHGIPQLQWNDTYPEYDVEDEPIKLIFSEKIKKLFRKRVGFYMISNNECCEECGREYE